MKKNIFIVIGLLIVSFVLWFFIIKSKNSLFGFQASPTGELILNYIIVFISIISGVILGSLYRHLIKLQNDKVPAIEWRKLFSDVNSGIDFKIAIIGAPLVFLAIINSANGMNLSGLVLFGLEHGFISPIIIKQFTTKSQRDNNNDTK